MSRTKRLLAYMHTNIGLFWDPVAVMTACRYVPPKESLKFNLIRKIKRNGRM